MKTILRVSVILGLLLSLPFNALAFSYYITFTGSGASTTVDSVIVQNLYKGTQVKVPAGTDLRLYDVETSVNELNTIADFAGVYPNPMNCEATFSFVANNEGIARVSIYGIDGKKITGLERNLNEGKNSFQLTLPKGVYLVQTTGKGYTYTAKTISLAMTGFEPAISFTGNSTASKPLKVTLPVVKMQYSQGDQLLYKGYSGNYLTLVTDKPGDSKITDFKFVDCTDADGNHYAVVHIGTQTWMAENLKTTKFRNGEAITEQWAYNNDVNNVAKYGKLFSWNAVADSRNIAPAGWHVPSDGEWTILENYLIANGYNYDGTTTGNKIAKAIASNISWKNISFIGATGNDLTRNNSSGFSAVSAGYRDNNSNFILLGEETSWWCNSTSGNDAFIRNMSYNYSDLYRTTISKSYGLSVRCMLGDLPAVTTAEVTEIESTTATCGGEVINEGITAVTERGVCWSTNPKPTIADSKTINGTGTGSFISNITGLIPGRTYYVRAYATNSLGTAYGIEKSFTTTKPIMEDCGTVTDIDGNVYKTIRIGNQCWMAENLKTTRYRNGERIGTTTPATKDIIGESRPKYQWAYEGNEENVAKYGRLYTWYAATDSRGIAPAGWHVPTDAEWTELENYLIANGYNYDGTTAGNKIAKAMAATTDWYSSTTTGAIGNDLTKNNSSGFTAFPGGYRNYYSGNFDNVGSSTSWWNSNDPKIYKERRLYYDDKFLYKNDTTKGMGFSVRCVKDIVETVNIPAGTFTMGSPTSEVSRDNDETQHEVTLSAFRMSKYEITNAQYAAFLNAKGIGSDGKYAAGAYPTQALIYASSGSYDWGLHYTNNQWIPVAGYENHPVINVTWYGATEYATYVDGSLPTEAQWEYACRAGSTTPFNTGSCLTNLQANYRWDNPYSTCTNSVTTYPGKTQPVGSYSPNAYGLYDMHGNVWEWCSDWYGTYPTDAQTNPTGPATGSYRVYRGGSWLYDAQFCRSAVRSNSTAYDYEYYIGFRVVFVP